MLTLLNLFVACVRIISSGAIIIVVSILMMGGAAALIVIIGGNGEFTIVTMLTTSNYAVYAAYVCRYVPAH